MSTARSSLVGLLIVLGAAMPLSPAAAAAQQTRAIVSVAVNGADVGESIVVIRASAGDVLIPVDVLDAGGVTEVPGPRDTIDGRAFVSLRSMAPAVSFRLDEIESRLEVQASPALFARRVMDLSVQTPRGMVRARSTSAFFNYAANWNGTNAPLVSGELGVHAGPALLTTTVSRHPDGTIRRGLSTLTFDRVPSMTRASLGDLSIDAGPLWGSTVVAGIGIGREFPLNPYFVYFPTPSLSETVTTPSTLDVYVNDRLVRQVAVAPGTVDLAGIPAPAGPGEARIVIRDAFGRTREAGTTYYVTTSVLARGLHDYQYGVGWERSSDLAGGVRYGQPLLSLSHRVGLTDSVTIGGRAEGRQGLLSAGPIATMRWRPVGEVEVAGSASDAAGTGGGYAASTAWTYAGRRLGFGAAARSFSPSYVSVSAPTPAGRRRIELSAFASVPVGRVGTLTLHYQDARQPRRIDGVLQEERRRRASLGGSNRLTRRAQLLWTAGRTWGSVQSGLELTAGVSIGIGSNNTVTMAAQRRDDRPSASVLLQRPLSASEGFGYRVRADAAGNTGEGALQYQNRYGRYEVRQHRANGTMDTTFNLAGGIVAIGRTVQFARPVEQSYALVQVPGVSGVRVFSSNLEAGRTDRRGNLLLPALLPNYANRVAVSEQDVPADRAVPDGEKLIAPPWRGGAVITFPVAKLQGATGRLAIVRRDGTRVTPAFGRLRVITGDASQASPIGGGGEFFLEQAAPGPVSVSLDYRGDTCRFTMIVPAVEGTLADLGGLVCREQPVQVVSDDR